MRSWLGLVARGSRANSWDIERELEKMQEDWWTVTTPARSALLIDKDQIIDLVHEYSYFVDHGLYDDVVELFTEDCLVDYGIVPPVHSRANLRRMFGHPGAGFAADQPPQR